MKDKIELDNQFVPYHIIIYSYDELIEKGGRISAARKEGEK
ncbi:MAG: hypothetical protein R6U41_11475 [Desulfosalsimonas sp.]